MVPTTGFLQRGVQLSVIQHVAGFQIFHSAARNGQVDVFIHPSEARSLSPNQSRFRGKLFASFNRVDGFEEAEAPGKQFCFPTHGL